MPKPYAITFTELAKAAAETSSSLAAVEAFARAEIDDQILWAGVPDCEIDLPPWGFHSFDMPDGTEFVALFHGPDLAEIDAVVRHESADRIEDKADWLGVSGRVGFPVPATRK